MKLWVGLVGMLGLAAAHSQTAAALDSVFTDEERAKACKCELAPNNCNQHCRKCGLSFIEECGKKYAKTCKKLGFIAKTEKCADCSDQVPTTCEDCESLGKVCIKNNNVMNTCKQLGFGKKGCPVTCSQVVPSTCEDCKNLGKVCIKKQGLWTTCKAFGWNPKKETCPVDCPQVVPQSCADCKDQLGKVCVVQVGKQKECKVFGYNAKEDTCPVICDKTFEEPTTCEDCEALGPVCIRENGAKKTCKKLGYRPINGCPEKI
jgi:hypothetical protein